MLPIVAHVVDEEAAELAHFMLNGPPLFRWTPIRPPAATIDRCQLLHMICQRRVDFRTGAMNASLMSEFIAANGKFDPRVPDVNKLDVDGSTPLHIIARFAQDEGACEDEPWSYSGGEEGAIVDVLLRAGARDDIVNIHGETARDKRRR